MGSSFLINESVVSSQDSTSVAETVGSDDGLELTAIVGSDDGLELGLKLGAMVGKALGKGVSAMVGVTTGASVVTAGALVTTTGASVTGIRTGESVGESVIGGLVSPSENVKGGRVYGVGRGVGEITGGKVHW